ncbi:MAG: hypothetical protein IJ121_02875 [Eubacterium sp.]|nr:hypothetical protein [Eubacterium sp.]
MNREIVNALRQQAEATLNRKNKLRATPYERAFYRGVLHALNSLQEGENDCDERGNP